MKMLIIDHDDVAAHLVKSKLEAQGHDVVIEPDKNAAVDALSNENYDVVFIDPSPMNSVKPLVLNIRRSVTHYPYVMLLSPDSDGQSAMDEGVNDVISKPLDLSLLEEKISNASRLTTLISRLSDTAEDFPSAGGVIAKSAFNQLFLSAMDRADRYGEQSYVLFITMNNYHEVNSVSDAEMASARLSQGLVLLRRQSDIIGQTAKNEFALLLQRPSYDQEPFEATNRFAEALSQNDSIVGEVNMKAKMDLALMELPSGKILVQHNF